MSAEPRDGAAITPPVEDYLKAIFTLSSEEPEDDRVSTSAIAERMQVSAASATSMMQRLAEMKLADYVPYQGVALTDAGEKIALEIIRHHRLLELYLAEALGYPWDAVHDEAERLEHVISEEFEDRIDAMLGHPTTDPHGHPIPPKSGRMPDQEDRRLSDVEAGEVVVVRRVHDRDVAVLRALSSLELFPGVELRVVDRTSDGPITVERAGKRVRLERELARTVFVG